MTGFRKTNGPAWFAVLALVIGLALLDRSFTRWRNDPRSLPYANGAYPTVGDVPATQRARLANRSALQPLALAGAGFMMVSVVLFAVFPFQPGGMRTED